MPNLFGQIFGKARNTASSKPQLIVKVGRDGTVYLNKQPTRSTPADFAEALRQLKAQGGLVVYYRERPQEDPIDAAMLPLQAIGESGVGIVMGQTAPSEWGTPSHVELEETPGRFRLFIATGQPLLAAVLPPGDEKGLTVLARPANWAPLLAELDFHIRSDRVFETTMNRPESVFDDKLQGEEAPPSLHIRIGYNQTQSRWQSYYPLDKMPPNIRSFYEAAYEMAERLTKAHGKEISGEQAMNLFP